MAPPYPVLNRTYILQHYWDPCEDERCSAYPGKFRQPESPIYVVAWSGYTGQTTSSFGLVAICFPSVLWNRNDFLRFWFRFLLLKSYGSGSDFWKSYVSGSGSYYWKVTVLVPYRFQLHIWTIRSNFFKKYFGIFFAFLPGKLFDKEKVYKFQQIYCEMWMKFFF